MTSHYNTLPAPVVLVTKGRGREVFVDSSILLARLGELPLAGGEVMQIETEGRFVAPAGIAALNTLLRCGCLDRFDTAAKRQPHAARRPHTKYRWDYLSEYLGWKWIARK
jgi:hypothetical protein